MRSVIIILGGFVLLAIALLIGRFVGIAMAAKVFIPVWFVIAAINMWMGTQRGYSFGEELPIFLVIFLVPSAVAAFIAWKY